MPKKFQPFVMSPCKMCPFKKDTMEGWLGKERAEEIIHSIYKMGDGFTCHNTNDFSGEDVAVTIDSKGCAGAAILLDKVGQHNAAMQIAYRLGYFKIEDVRGRELIFETTQEFIDHHEH